MTLRCVIVDDSIAFVVAARSLLEHEGMTVLGAATNGADALRQAAELAAPTSYWSISILVGRAAWTWPDASPVRPAPRRR